MEFNSHKNRQRFAIAFILVGSISFVGGLYWVRNHMRPEIVDGSDSRNSADGSGSVIAETSENKVDSSSLGVNSLEPHLAESSGEPRKSVSESEVVSSKGVTPSVSVPSSDRGLAALGPKIEGAEAPGSLPSGSSPSVTTSQSAEEKPQIVGCSHQEFILPPNAEIQLAKKSDEHEFRFSAATGIHSICVRWNGEAMDHRHEVVGDDHLVTIGRLPRIRERSKIQISYCDSSVVNCLDKCVVRRDEAEEELLGMQPSADSAGDQRSPASSKSNHADKVREALSFMKDDANLGLRFTGWHAETPQMACEGKPKSPARRVASSHRK